MRGNEHMSYDDAADYLRRNSILVDTLSKPSKKASPSTMLRLQTESKYDGEETDDELDFDEAFTLVNHMIAVTNIHHVYNVLNSRTLRQNLKIPHPIWKRLEPALS